MDFEDKFTAVKEEVSCLSYLESIEWYNAMVAERKKHDNLLEQQLQIIAIF